jgi:hypothetical protein
MIALTIFWLGFAIWVGYLGCTLEYTPIRWVCGLIVGYSLYWFVQGVKRVFYEKHN